MNNRIVNTIATTSLALAALCGTGGALAQEYAGCGAGEIPVAVKGKIFNNGQVGSPLSTLGVVALQAGEPVGKMKCGIAGLPATPDNPALPLAFTHVISCDDEVVLPIPGNPVVHSQISFDTRGYFHEDFAFCNGVNPSQGISSSFTEFSSPRVGEGRGVFTTTTGGQLIVEGSISCFGTIDMEFKGEICLAVPGS